MLYGLQTASINLRHADFEHRRKTNVVIDPSSVRENGLGDQAWSPEDFEPEPQEEDVAEGEQRAMTNSFVRHLHPASGAVAGGYGVAEG
jgi:hypothetical protein